MTDYSTIVAHVEDRPGVLARVASLFRRRGFNIESLTVGKADEPGLSRMTIVVEGGAGTVAQVERQLFKLIDVVSVVDISNQPVIDREMSLIKVSCLPAQLVEVGELVKAFRADIVDVGPQSIIVQVLGDGRESCRGPGGACCAPTASWRWSAPAGWPWCAAAPASPRPSVPASSRRRPRGRSSAVARRAPCPSPATSRIWIVRWRSATGPKRLLSCRKNLWLRHRANWRWASCWASRFARDYQGVLLPPVSRARSRQNWERRYATRLRSRSTSSAS